MKKTIIFLAVLLMTITGFSQAKSDSLKADSIKIQNVLTELITWTHDKNLGIQDYERVINILNAYWEEKKKQYKK